LLLLLSGKGKGGGPLESIFESLVLVPKFGGLEIASVGGPSAGWVPCPAPHQQRKEIFITSQIITGEIDI